MPTPAPAGIFPMFIRGVTCEKYGMKTGENVMDLVDYIWIPKEDVVKEIATLGVMSDFETARKQIDQSPGDKLLFVVDQSQEYGESFLLYYTVEQQNTYMKQKEELEAAIEAQKRAEQEAEEAAAAAALARLTVEYEDKPITPKPWVSTSAADSDAEIKLAAGPLPGDKMGIAVTRPKRYTKQNVKLTERDAEVSGLNEFRSHKDINFRAVKETEGGYQSAPEFAPAFTQTTWYRSVSKAVQYQAQGVSCGSGPEGGQQLLDSINSSQEAKEALCEFLSRSTLRIEKSLQQNETIDIFQETFQTKPDDELMEGAGAHLDNHIRELKNFADPTYSKFKSLPAIDWMPKAQGLVAVSAVKNMTFEQRVQVMGQTCSAYILLWDFKHLVRPQVLMQCEHEVHTFKFNAKNSHVVAGGCISGQVLLWDLKDAMELINSRSRRGVGGVGMDADADEDEAASTPIVQPKYVSSIDYCHKRAVTDVFWLPPNTQINYRGHLVAQEHLDDKSHQFISVSTDGQVMVWDTRYEMIAQDELRHIGRAKHVPMEKVSNKGDGNADAAKPHPPKTAQGNMTPAEQEIAAASNSQFKPIWTPIFKAHLKRVDGVGELSLCKVSYTGGMNTSLLTPPVPEKPTKGQAHQAPPDPRSQLLLSTEEGDIIMADVCATKAVAVNRGDDDEDDGEGGRDFVKWIAHDHSRPAVALQISPFFPDIAVSISDWAFHIWKVGSDIPVFTSPTSPICFTGGAWSPTRPAVLFVTTADGHMLAWDFTDSSYRPSIELNVTHTKITSFEFLVSAGVSVAEAATRQQLIAIGDESGTLHISEIPRNLARPVHKEEQSMAAFLDREYNCITHNYQMSLAAAGGENAFGGNDNSSASAAANNANAVPAATAAEVRQAELEALKKEDDDFAALESKFMTELNLTAQ